YPAPAKGLAAPVVMSKELKESGISNHCDRRTPYSKTERHDAIMTLAFSATRCACSRRFFKSATLDVLPPFVTKSQPPVELSTLAILHGRWINHKDPHS